MRTDHSNSGLRKAHHGRWPGRAERRWLSLSHDRARYALDSRTREGEDAEPEHNLPPHRDRCADQRRHDECVNSSSLQCSVGSIKGYNLPLPGLFAADTPALIRSPPHTRYFTYVPARFQKYVMAHVILRIRSGFQQGRLPVEQTRRRAGVLVVVRTCRRN